MKLNNSALEHLAKSLARTYHFHPWRGYGRINNLISRFVGKRPFVVYVFGKKFCFDLFDAYWNQLLSPSFCYEPEIQGFLEQNLGSDSVFIDCGANYGYWTLWALTKLDGDSCYSIEASPKTFAHLKRNLEINCAHPIAINRAVTKQSGLLVSIETVGENHAGAAISGLKNFSNASSIQVKSISLAEILASVDKNKPVFIKIDVEGAEIDAISGIGKFVEHTSITILFEELNDDCPVSRFLLSGAIGNWNVQRIEADGTATDIDLKQARVIASATRGPVNFVAQNSLIGDVS